MKSVEVKIKRELLEEGFEVVDDVGRVEQWTGEEHVKSDGMLAQYRMARQATPMASRALTHISSLAQIGEVATALNPGSVASPACVRTAGMLGWTVSMKSASSTACAAKTLSNTFGYSGSRSCGWGRCEE